MTCPDADALFRAFLSNGDPAALGRLFDLLAPDLLLVAVHLIGDGAAAEDLVQGTFVRAIEERVRFDPARPVRPWLVGILGNLALQARRTAARRPDPRRLAPRPTPSASEEAQARELATAVSQAIEELPLDDRQVLTLRLVHGFKVLQIARALGVPVPTAKARLRRALARLRRVLPQGLAPGVIGAELSGDLAALRARVVARAAELAPAGVIAGAAIGKLLTGVAVLALLGAAMWFGQPDPAAAPGPSGAGLGTATPVAARSEAASAAMNGDAAVAPARVAVLGSTPATTLQLRGRCVARESGAPLAGCEITVTPRATLMRTPQQLAAWRAVADRSSMTTSGADGRFALQPPDAGGLDSTVLVRAPGRVAAACRLEPKSASADLGDVVLARSVPVTGRIVDSNGQPMVGASCSFLSAAILESRGAGVFVEVFEGNSPRADADGRFEIAHGLGVGEWLVRASSDTTVLRPDLFLIGDDQLRAAVEVVVLRRSGDERISGIVRNQQGEPLAEVSVSAAREPNGVRTTADGAFELQRTTGPDPVPSLHVEDHRWRVAPRDVPGPFAWGTADVVIEMEPVRELRVQVVEAATNEPVERFAVQRSAIFDPTGALAIRRQRLGIAVVPGVEWGRTALLVIPEDGELEPSGPVLVEASRLEGGVLRVALHRRAAVRVRVVHSDGTPVQGSTVEILADDGRPGVMPAALPVPGYRLDTAALFALQLGSAVTDVAGEAVLHVAPARQERGLRVRGAHVLLERRNVVLQSNGEPLLLVVSVGGVLRGSVQPLAMLQDLRDRTTSSAATAGPLAQAMALGLALHREGPAPQGFPIGLGAVPIDDQGRFEMTGVPPGHWEVSMCSYQTRPGGGSGTLVTRLAEVDITDGAAREIELDLAPLTPATLDGDVELDGAPLASGFIELEREEPSASAGRLRTDRAGRFSLTAAPAGRYRVFVEVVDERTGQRHHIPTREACTLRPGETVRQVFRARRLVARIRVFEADGVTPAAGRNFQVRPSRSNAADHATDGDGWLVLDPAPACPFTLQAAELRAARGGASWMLLPGVLGPLEVAADQRAAEFTVRLPQ